VTTLGAPCGAQAEEIKSDKVEEESSTLLEEQSEEQGFMAATKSSKIRKSKVSDNKREKETANTERVLPKAAPVGTRRKWDLQTVGKGESPAMELHQDEAETELLRKRIDDLEAKVAGSILLPAAGSVTSMRAQSPDKKHGGLLRARRKETTYVPPGARTARRPSPERRREPSPEKGSRTHRESHQPRKDGHRGAFHKSHNEELAQRHRAREERAMSARSVREGDAPVEEITLQAGQAKKKQEQASAGAWSRLPGQSGHRSKSPVRGVRGASLKAMLAERSRSPRRSKQSLGNVVCSKSAVLHAA